MNIDTHAKSGESPCECIMCQVRRPFTMPPDIVHALEKGELVIFAGAGVSTESHMIAHASIYQEVKKVLKIPPKKRISFSNLMSKFCEREDGRRKLLNRIRERFEYLDMYPASYRHVVRFHRELSTLYQIKEIITTNWDDYFERESGAIPFVSPKDFVFWNNDVRKVLKVHGSVTNYSSIIVTRDDYERCYSELQNNSIGAYLKMLLTTKKILFVGYSFGDEDFNQIYKILMSDIKDVVPKSYIVTLDEASKKKFEKMNCTTIITDATYFIEELKKIEIKKGNIVADKKFELLSSLNEYIFNARKRILKLTDIKKTPMLLYTESYWDGISHCIGFLKIGKKKGKFSHSCETRNLLDSVRHIRRMWVRKEDYERLAYTDGFIACLLFFLDKNPRLEKINPYYLLGEKSGIKTEREYLNLCKKVEKKNTGPYRSAKAYTSRTPKILYPYIPPSIFPKSSIPDFD